MLTQEESKALEEALAGVVDKTVGDKLDALIAPMVSDRVAAEVKALRLREATGETRISDESKTKLVNTFKTMLGIKLKDTSALILDQDSRGGYLVPVEVASEILRIAYSVGVVSSQATKWDMKSDELDIPSYRGSALTGSFLGVDVAGTTTGLTFNSARLIAKQWQLAFVVGNDLLADATANLADWLMALAGESEANMIDQQAFIGTGAPFVGITKDSNVATYYLGGSSTSGSTAVTSLAFSDVSNAIAQIEECFLDGAAWYMNRTTWAVIRALADTNKLPIISQANAAEVLVNEKVGGGPKVMGVLLGYPVYTVRHLPSTISTSTIFAVFGNLKNFAYGDRGQMSVAQFESGAFGGNEIALTNQRAFVVRHRFALVNALPSAFVNISTSAS